MVYLDNAATTPMDPEVIDIMTESMQRDFANSGTVYAIGLDARKRIEQAEAEICESLNIPSRFRLIFTSGGSESNNLFIKGYAFPDKKIASLGLEHPSILATLDYFRESGNAPFSLKARQKEGRLDLAAVSELRERKVRLLCLSHVNNELGSVNDPLKIVPALQAESPQTRLFLDGVQAVGKISIGRNHWEGISGYSLSGHKFNGPKGIGALVVDADLPLKPQIHGGRQQFGMRSGTLPVPLILGLARAVRLAAERVESRLEHYRQLRARLIDGMNHLRENNPRLNLHINSSLSKDTGEQCPAIVNFSFAPVEGEVVLHHLEKRGIFVGLGSACSAHSKEPSKILLGIGLTREEARCSLRISFGPQNASEDVDVFLHEFAEAYETLYPTFHQKIASR